MAKKKNALDKAVEKPGIELTAVETGQEVSGTNRIGLYFHCGQCAKSKPDGYSLAGWKDIEAGWTPLGFQVWCKRHQANIVHVDFQGLTHATNPPGVWAVSGQSPSQAELLSVFSAALSKEDAEALAELVEQEKDLRFVPIRDIIPNDRQITTPVRCPQCAAEYPNDSQLDNLAAGWTELGLQIWCERHDCNALHIGFEGVRHVGNTTSKRSEK